MTSEELDRHVIQFVDQELGYPPNRIRELKTVANWLYERFGRSRNPSIGSPSPPVDEARRYDDPRVQAVYLLGWFPGYRGMARTAFGITSIRTALPGSGEPKLIRIVSLGCGPLPDLLGLLDVLAETGEAFPSRIDATGIDAADWGRWVRRFEAILSAEHRERAPISVRFVRISAGEVPSESSDVSTADLLVAQNVVCEHACEPEWLSRFGAGLARAPAGAVLLLMDFISPRRETCWRRAALVRVINALAEHRNVEYISGIEGDPFVGVSVMIPDRRDRYVSHLVERDLGCGLFNPKSWVLALRLR